MFGQHYVRAHGAALGFMRNEQEARETAHDALLKAWQARDRYDETRPFYPWLYRIIRNTCFDALARRQHRAVPGLDAERVSDDSRSTEELVEASRDVTRLSRAMDTLEPAQQDVLNLRHFQGLSYAEIAQLLEVPEGTVMSRLYRARKALAAAFEEAR